MSSPQSCRLRFRFLPLFRSRRQGGEKEDREQELDSREGQLTPAMGVSPSLTKSLAFTSPPYLRISSAGGGSGEKNGFRLLSRRF